jgi:hypothetical protein
MCSVTFNRLESLSNELLLDIFEYLDAYNLCQAFYGLNHRLNTLLQSAHLHILYDSSKENKIVWDILTSFFNPLQIRILSSYDDINFDERFLSSDNKNLHSVRLLNVNREYINKIFQHFSNDNQVKCLYVREKIQYYSQNTRSVVDLLLVDHAHRFVSLVNLSLSPSQPIGTFPIVPVTFSQLRHLSIKSYFWTPELLQFFQDNTPNLRSLKFIGYFPMVSPLSKSIKHIHELHTTNPNPHSFNIMDNLLSNFPCLHRLHIDWEYNRRNPVFNGSQWQQLIEKHLPHLKQLTIDFSEGIDEDILKTFYTGEFWLTKKVKVKMVINKTQSRYRLVKTIYFGNEWRFEYFDDL